MKNILISFLAGLVAVVCFAEGTITETKVVSGPVAKYTLSWTASTNGIVSSEDTSFHVRGEISRVVLSGTSTGATYSLTLKDTSGVDVLAGNGSTVATNSASSFTPGEGITDGVTTSFVPFAVNDILTLDVTVAGSNRTGSAVLYVK